MSLDIQPTSPLPTKTPVSLLQELCMRRGISPVYDLLQIEGPVHEPTFVYRVTVGEYAANGSGQTKKKAKHAAAKAVLDKIIQGGINLENVSPNNSTEITAQVSSPYDDGIPGNPVGSLQELCMSRRWPPPTYELTAEEGYPHERTFSISCLIGQHKEIGNGKSKKLSKRKAANKMLQKLKDLPADQPSMSILADEDEEISQRLSVRYAGQKDSKFGLFPGDSRKATQFHKNLKQDMGPLLEELQQLCLSDDKEKTVERLQGIADESNFIVTFVEIEEKSASDQHQCLVQLSTAPVTVCYGTGTEMNKAQTSAALKALEYLQLMTKK